MSFILIIEPDESIADRAREALREEGWQVQVVADRDSGVTAMSERAPDLVLVGGAVADDEQFVSTLSRRHGGPGVVAIVDEGDESASSPDVDGVLERPLTEETIRVGVRTCLAQVQRRAAKEWAEAAESAGAQFTSDELFGDMLAEVESADSEEVASPPPQPSEPEIEPPAAEVEPSEPVPSVDSPAVPPSTSPTAAEGGPAAADEDVEREVEKTLSGVLESSADADERTPDSAAAEEEEVDELLSETLSGLGVADRRADRRRREREVAEPEEEAAEEPAAPEPESVAEAEEEPESPASREVETAAAEPDAEESEEVAGERFGQYTLLDRIAVGGMAEVWKARMQGMEGFQKNVAIKKILSHLTDSADFVTMFIDEAKLAAQLNHPNIIHIYDLGKIDEDYYIAMEYVDGKDLRTILNTLRRRDAAMPLGLVLLVSSRLASGLDYAHRKRDFDDRELGLVHRDVSPQNVLISYEGDIKLCDFGIVKAVSKASTTKMGALKGKLQYMSPEQASGEVVDARSDIFSLGTLMYEMLTRERLFAGESELSILESVKEGRVRSPREVEPEVPDEVAAIVDRALAKDPDGRHQTAGDMQKEIEEVLYGLTPTPGQAELSGWVRGMYGVEATGLEEEEQAASEQPRPAAATETDEDFVEAIPGEGDEVGVEERPTRRWLIAAAAAVVLVTVALFLLLGGDEPAEDAVTAERSPPATEETTVTPVTPEESAPVVEASDGTEVGEADTETPPTAATEGATPSESEGSEETAGDGVDEAEVEELVDEELAAKQAELERQFEEERRRLQQQIEAAKGAEQEEGTDRKGDVAETVERPAEEPVEGSVAAETVEQPTEESPEDADDGTEATIGPESEGESTPSPTGETDAAAADETAPVSSEEPGVGSAVPTGEEDAAADAADVAESTPPTEPGSSVPSEATTGGEPTTAPPATSTEQPVEAEPEPEPTPTVRRGDLVDATAPGVTPPSLLGVETPQYPPIARRMQVEGTVVVRVLVDENGAVTDAQVAQSSGRDVGFDEAALAAARSARYRPARKDGVAVKTWVRLSVPFEM